MAGKKVLSIELNEQMTRICEIDFKSKKPTIYNCCKFETPEGAIEEGYIRNREILSVAMKEHLAKLGIKNQNVVFSISSNKIANREVVLPLVSENKIQALVQSNANEYFPVNIDEYVVTYKLLEKLVKDEEKSMRLMVLAAPSALIESYYDFAQLMSFEIVAIDYVGNSCYQIIKKQTGNGVNVVVQINESNTLINILEDETLSLQRTIPYGANNIVNAALNCGEFGIEDRESAMEKLFTEQLINAKLDESVIDDVAMSYMENNDDSYSSQLREMKAKEDITETFKYLINNVVRVLDYYIAKNPSKKVTALHLSGVGSRIKGISHLFKNEIFIDINRFDNILGAEFMRTTGITDAEKSDFMIVIGAIMEPIDFIPKEHAVKIQKKNEAKGMMIVFVGCLSLAALLVIVPIVMNLIEKSNKKKVESDIENLSDVEKLCASGDATKLDRKNAEAIYAQTNNKNTLLNIFIKELESALPPSVTVDGITSSDGGDGSGVTINFTATSWGDVAKTVANLRSDDYVALIDTVVVDAMTSNTSDAGVQTVTFSTNCTLKDIPPSTYINEELTEALIRGESSEKADDKKESKQEESEQEESEQEESKQEDNKQEDNKQEDNKQEDDVNKSENKEKSNNKVEKKTKNNTVSSSTKKTNSKKK